MLIQGTVIEPPIKLYKDPKPDGSQYAVKYIQIVEAMSAASDELTPGKIIEQLFVMILKAVLMTPGPKIHRTMVKPVVPSSSATIK